MSVNFLKEHQIAQFFPKAFEDFIEFYNASQSKSLEIQLEDLPFQYQLGWYFEYFEKNAVSINIIDISELSLKESVIESFKAMEHILSHYS